MRKTIRLAMFAMLALLTALPASTNYSAQKKASATYSLRVDKVSVSVPNLYTSNFGDLNTAISQAQAGATITIDVPLTQKKSVSVNKPIRIVFAQTVDFSAATDHGHGIVVASPGVELVGMPGVVSVKNTRLSAVLIASGSDDCLIDGISSQNYNTSNTNGNAGVFALGVPNQINRLKLYRVRTLGGNGNGIRLGNVQDVVVRDCYITLTRGQSAEGITINGSDVDIDRTTVIRALTTGILVYLDRDQSNIRITNCNVIDSSQAVLKPPQGINQVGSNFAVEVQVLKYNLKGLVIDNLCAYDDQTVPTQNGPLKIGNNNQHGTVSLRPPTFTSWGNKTEVPELIFDNQQAQYKILA